MADRIPTFESRVGVQDAGSFRPVLPDVADAGPSIARVGRSLLAVAEPILERKAQEQALADAGSADIVKTSEGYARAEGKRSGTAYATVFNKVMDDRLLQLTTKDFEDNLARLQTEHAEDPETFFNKARGIAEGVMKTADPRIRASLEGNLVREISERFRGLNQQKQSRDYQATVNGLLSSVDSYSDEIGKIYETGAEGAAERAAIPYNRALDAIDNLEELGALSEAGADAERLKLELRIGTKKQYAEGAQLFAKFGPSLAAADDDQLARLRLFSDGTTDGGTVPVVGEDGKTVQVNLAGFQAMFTSEVWRDQVGSTASRILSQRQAAEAQRRAEAAQAAQLEATKANTRSVEALSKEVRDGNRDPVNGYNSAEVAAIDSELFRKHGSTFQMMQSQAGRDALIKHINSYGYLPEGLADYIDGHVLGEDSAIVLSMVSNLRRFEVNGAWTGQNAYEQLSEQTRATVEFDQALRRAGITDASQRLSMLREARTRQLPTDKEARAMFEGREAGRGYNQTRDAALAKAFGMDIQQIRVNPAIVRDYDTMFRFNVQLYNGNVDKAAWQTAYNLRGNDKEGSGSWVKSPVFSGNVAPRRFDRGLHVPGGVVTMNELSRALPIGSTDRGANFLNGRLKLRPTTQDVAQGYGNYYLEERNAQGRIIRTTVINGDRMMELARADAIKRIKAEADANRNKLPTAIGARPEAPKPGRSQRQ